MKTQEVETMTVSAERKVWTDEDFWRYLRMGIATDWWTVRLIMSLR
jgi:hypothetical protein